MAEGVCIPRNTLYLHYVDFCARNAMQPVNAASFGKARVLHAVLSRFSVPRQALYVLVGRQPFSVSFANVYY